MEGTPEQTQQQPEQAKEVEMTDANNQRILKVRSIDGSTFEVNINKDVSVNFFNFGKKKLPLSLQLTQNILDSNQRSEECPGREVISTRRQTETHLQSKATR